MNSIPQVFDFNDQSIRVMIKEGKPWFVANDVCQILNHSNPRMAIKQLDEDEKGVNKVYTLGGEQEMMVINEPGLYSLILRSNKPEAKLFKRWITHEVIPSIRKTGQYSVEKKPFEITTSLAEALRLAADLAEEKEHLQQQNRCMAPKAEAFDMFLTAENAQTMCEVAKVLGTGQNRLFFFLREQNILMTGGERHNLPYQSYLDQGYFRVKERTFSIAGKSIIQGQTLVTPKGVNFIAQRLGLKTSLAVM